MPGPDAPAGAPPRPVVVRPLTGDAIAARLDDLSALRMRVFADWPYLYDGDAAQERSYMAAFAQAPDAFLAGAFDAGELVGAATALPLAGEPEDFAAAFARAGLPVDRTWYLAESVLLPEYRGRGAGHRFFDLREAMGRELGFAHAGFCAVIRPEDHPDRPEGARSHDAFWRGRGYAPLPGGVARLAWRDRGETGETEKELQIWAREL